MEKPEIKQKVENGKVLLDLAEEFNNKEVSITVSTTEDIFQDEKNRADLPAAKRVEVLKRFAGTAKYPDVETNKYEVYEQ